MAPRNEIADSAKQLPDNRPTAVDRQVLTWLAPGFSDITITPAVPIRMAATDSGVSRSARKIRPNSATCTGSVLM